MESISIAERSIPCRSQGLLTCSLAYWLNRRSPSVIPNPSARSIEEETGIKKQKSPRRVPVQLKLQVQRARPPRRGQNRTKSKTEQKDRRRHDLDRGGMGYMLAQRDASKSDREGLEEPEERRERRERKRERSEIERHATAWVAARREEQIAHAYMSTRSVEYMNKCEIRPRAGPGETGQHEKCKDSPGGLREGGCVCSRSSAHAGGEGGAHRTATRCGPRVWSGQNRGVHLQVQGEECGVGIDREGGS
ncbi:hypothetical protein B0H13DRAFT_1909485 [Mycena leptocephala]|nr:hypothetical protein B0H13DRAFT_1909485 [Mycena leptocephala]